MMKIFLMMMLGMSGAQAAELKAGDKAPDFSVKTHEGKNFSLSDRKDQWTVLYFYPKADTPGCTKQACAFRDSINKIREQKADVFGVSGDSVEDQAKFHKKHHLNFILLADADHRVIKAYQTQMPMMNYSKRWTFIVGPDLTIRHIERDVDPVKDAGNTAKLLATLQKK